MTSRASDNGLADQMSSNHRSRSRGPAISVLLGPVSTKRCKITILGLVGFPWYEMPWAGSRMRRSAGIRAVVTKPTPPIHSKTETT
jgi:hypothetical protein